MRWRLRKLMGPVAGAAALAASAPVFAGPAAALRECRLAGVDEPLRCATVTVPENRERPNGRNLELEVYVLPARKPVAGAAPIYVLAGGPGETNSEIAPDMVASPLRQEHDIVFADQRGTGGGNRLDCPPPADAGLQRLLDTPLDVQALSACRDELARRADLTAYTTVASAHDLEDVRRALGHGKINLHGGSFGTYLGLVYMREHGEHVNAAVFYSLVTLENRVPLYHAREGQRGFERLAEDCAADPVCRAAYPDLRGDLAAVLARLRREPARAVVTDAASGRTETVTVDEGAFATALRLMLYNFQRQSRAPLLLQRAKAGDFAPFAELAIAANRGVYDGMRWGLHLAVSCNEFTARIGGPDEVARETAGTFLGDLRVRQQQAVCAIWPKTALPRGWDAPWRGDAPVLLITGHADPVSPPHWGDKVKAALPNAVHLVIPGGHYPADDCTESIGLQLFRTASLQRLDTSCVAAIRRPAWALPSGGG